MFPFTRVPIFGHIVLTHSQLFAIMSCLPAASDIDAEPSSVIFCRGTSIARREKGAQERGSPKKEGGKGNQEEKAHGPVFLWGCPFLERV